MRVCACVDDTNVTKVEKLLKIDAVCWCFGGVSLPGFSKISSFVIILL